MIIIITILAYFCVLLLFSHITARRTSSNETFYRANRRSPWYMVAFGMVGASISGITFVSVPGMVMKTDMTYLQMCIGFILGYFLVGFLLLPIYYRYNLTTIYSYLQQRLGERSYKTGASFFLLSKMTGAAVRFFVVCILLQRFVLGDGTYDGDAHLALYPQGWHQDAGVDGFLPDYLHVCCAHPDYLSCGGSFGNDAI